MFQISIFAVDGADVAAKKFALDGEEFLGGFPSGFRGEGIKIDLSGFRIDFKISCFWAFRGENGKKTACKASKTLKKCEKSAYFR